MAPVAELELAILGYKVFGFEDCLGTATYEFGPVRAEVGRQRIEAFDKVVVELNQYFTSSHDHMVAHMVTVENTSTARPDRRARPAGPDQDLSSARLQPMEEQL